MTKKKTSTKSPAYEIDLKELLEAGVHFGHQARRWNPKMDEYIYTKREGVHIFDLGQTAEKLVEAMTFIRDLVGSGKEVVFIGTKRQAMAIIKEEAEKVNAPYVAVRWLGGLITNWQQLKKSIDKLNDMEEKKAKGEYKKYTKRENVMLDKQIDRLNHFLSGLRGLKQTPEAIFVEDVKKEEAAVKEAILKEVAVIGMVDTNSDPDMADYIIPANDDAVSSIKIIVNKICQAYADGRALRAKGKDKDGE
jgi:small subunit ribosomal protein S2